MMYNESSCSQGGEDVYVNQIIQKAVIEVDEKGTEAAAATAVGLMRCARIRESIPTVTVTLDRPFCFLVLSENDIVPFAGICYEPK